MAGQWLEHNVERLQEVRKDIDKAVLWVEELFEDMPRPDRVGIAPRADRLLAALGNSSDTLAALVELLKAIVVISSTGEEYEHEKEQNL